MEDRPMVLVVDLEAGTEEHRPMNDEEYAQYLKDQAEVTAPGQPIEEPQP